jgi:hypothetical protein
MHAWWIRLVTRDRNRLRGWRPPLLGASCCPISLPPTPAHRPHMVRKEREPAATERLRPVLFRGRLGLACAEIRGFRTLILVALRIARSLSSIGDKALCCGRLSLPKYLTVPASRAGSEVWRVKSGAKQQPLPVKSASLRSSFSGVLE